MNSVSGDSESGESNSSGQGEEKNIIDKILGEMKSEFNKTEKTPVTFEARQEVTEDAPMDSSLSNNVAGDAGEHAVKTEDSTNENHTEDSRNSEPGADDAADKPRIILSFKKPNTESPLKSNNSTGRRSLRHKTNSSDDKVDESTLKRSTRRRSKDCNESVLQSAIARKEKSYNESNKPQRLTRQLKPTPKILENLALAKQEKTKTEKMKPKVNDKQKSNDSDSFTETDTSKSEDNDRVHRKHRHKHVKHTKKAKRFKSSQGDSSKDSDSDQEEASSRQEEVACRRSRRISTSRLKDDSNTDIDEHSLQDSLNDESAPYPNSVECSTGGADLVTSRLCLCTQKTQYYLATSDEETTYCGAVDNIGDKIIGCSRTIDSKEIMLMRSSTRVPYTILCESHKNRLLRHNCCPTCGVFCTQGRFVECESKHHYHRDCQVSIEEVDCCPHCGSSAPSYDVNITMHSAKRPIFLPVQKTQYVSARMTFPNSYKHEDEIKCITPPLLPIGALEMQNSLEYGDEEYEIGDLVAAVKNNSVEKVAIILGSKSVDVNCKIPECNDGTVLHYAAQRGLVPVVHMLLVAGAQPDALDKDQNTPLMAAIVSSHNDVVRYLIKTGASIDLKGTDGMTALHLAAKCGNLKACESLLKAAAAKSFVNSQDDGGWTPLVWACEHGYADIANFLIYKGADASLRDVEHNVALHWAAFSGSSHIAELLLNKGCDVNAVNAHGDTPLHIGARQDMYNCNIVLLARGADVTLLNKNSESPLDCVPPGGDSYSPISLNITLQASIDDNCPNVILSNDISKGKEANPIQCYNNVDADPKPSDFRYITKNCTTSDDVKIETKISTLQYCQCEERCVDDDCLCGKFSVRCWYDEEGKLIPDFSFSDIPMIFECNDRCSCNAITCNNRVVQKGLTQRFELFKTTDKGWGIRTLRLIPKGSFVCEYVGEIITDMEADRREDDSFLFDLENRVCRNANDTDVYCIDAKFYGNFARFINHSCNPNLTSVKVFADHQDLRFPRIAFFANKDIAGDEELSFDYGEKFWIAKYKSFSCLCGSSDCKYSEDTMEMTMQNYQRRLEECA